MTTTPVISKTDTLPKLLLEKYRLYGDKKVAMYRKDLGYWVPYTWKDYYEKAKYFCYGLLQLGMQRGDKGAILGENDPEGYWAELAIQALGGTAYGIYTDAMPNEVKYFIETADARILIAQDQEQVDKILSIKDELADLRAVIYWDPKGMWTYSDPLLKSFDQVLEIGREYEKTHQGLFEQLIEQGKEDDLACFCYTSGTTGISKVAMFTHKNMITTVKYYIEAQPHTEDDQLLSYAPLAWGAEQLANLTANLISAATINFPEKVESMLSDMREIGPTIAALGGRQWDAMASMILSKHNDAGFLKRFIYNIFMPVGYKMADMRMAGKEPSVLWKALWKIAYWALFRPLQDKIGFLYSKVVFQGGASVGPDVMRFFNALGLNLRQLYGLQEGGGWNTMHRQGDVKYDTVGTPFRDDEIRILDSMELVIRSPRLFSGYYKNPEATAKAIRNGWLHTGDACNINDEGHMVYLDRVSDLMELSDGSKYSPTYLENRLRFCPYIRDVMVVGEKDKEYVTAIVNIDFDIVGRWAEKNSITYTTFTDLSQKDEIYNLTKPYVEAVNRNLPDASKIKKYVHLYKEFDPDEAELTRTRKLRRGYMRERYAFLIEAMYGDQDKVVAETEILYRDGRKGKISTPVKIAFVEA